MSNIKTDLELNSLEQQTFKSASIPTIWYSQYFIGEDRHLYKSLSLCCFVLFIASFKVLEYLLYSSLPLTTYWYKNIGNLGCLKYNVLLMSMLLILEFPR